MTEEIIPFAPRKDQFNRDAEEHLLSMCCLDEGDTVAACIAAQIRPESFYDPKHGTIYRCLHSMYVRGVPIDAMILLDELKKTKQLEGIGGVPFLSQVTGHAPTTAQLNHCLSVVRSLATRRDAINILRWGSELLHDDTGDIDSLMADIRSRYDSVLNGGRDPLKLVRNITEFELPPEDGPDDLLGRNRYISRGDGVLLVSSSGMGKSVMNLQWAVFCAMGRTFLGITCRKKLTSLIVQSEDADGDIGEVWTSVKISLGLTDEELLDAKTRVHVVRDDVNRGETFLASLRPLIAKIKPDLVWLNPLHSYAGCDIADAKEMGRFLREGLNAINRDKQFAWMVVHHTPKPATGKNVADRKWFEEMYNAAGSAELVNWARAGVNLKPADEEGKFELVLAKRGTRAEVEINIAKEGEIAHMVRTTRIPCAHSSHYVNIEGRKKPFKVVFWVERKQDDKPEDKEMKTATQFKETWTDAELMSGIPAHSELGGDPPAIHRLAMATNLHKPLSKSRWYDRLTSMKESGLIEHLPTTGKWRRTTKGDELFAEHQRNSP